MIAALTSPQSFLTSVVEEATWIRFHPDLPVGNTSFQQLPYCRVAYEQRRQLETEPR